MIQIMRPFDHADAWFHYLCQTWTHPIRSPFYCCIISLYCGSFKYWIWMRTGFVSQRGHFFSLPKHSEQSYSRDSSDHPTLPAVVFIGACSVGFVGCGEWLVHQLVAGVYAQTRLLMTSKAQSQNCNEKLTQVTVK